MVSRITVPIGKKAPIFSLSWRKRLVRKPRGPKQKRTLIQLKSRRIPPLLPMYFWMVGPA